MLRKLFSRPKDMGLNDYLILVTLCLSVFYVNFNTTAVANAVAAIQSQLNLSPSNAQWTLNLYLLVAASLIIVGGRLGDLLGRRILFMLGICSFWLALIIISFASSTTVLLLGRALQGIGAALVTPGALAIAKTYLDEQHQTMGISAVTAAMGLGYAVGPSLGGYLTILYDWHAIFWAMLPLLSLVLLLTVFCLKPPASLNAKITPQPLDVLGLILFILGMFLFVLGLVRGNDIGWMNLQALGSLLGGLLILFLFWRVESYTQSPLIDFSHFKNPLFMLSIAALGSTIFSLLTVLYFFNLYTQNSLLLNYTPFEAGIAMMPMSASMFLASLGANYLIKRWGLRRIALTGSLGMALGFIGFSFINLNTTYYSLWLPLFFCGTGLGLGMSSSLNLGMRSLPAQQAGEASGILSTTLFLAAIFSISIGSILFTHAGKLEVIKLMHADSISFIKMSNIHQLLTNQQHIFIQLLQQLSPEKQKLIISTLQYSALSSLHSVIILNLSIILVVAALTYFVLKEKR